MNSTLKNVSLVILNIFLLPVALVEYFILFWFCFGDGIFMIISVPCFFALFLAIQLFFLFRSKNKIIKTALIYTSVFITPMLAVASSYLTAYILNINIIIH